jgi:hypothetical protein
MSGPSENATKKEFKSDKKGAGKWKHNGNKEKKLHKKGEQETSDSNLEMDSRLLSALLTVCWFFIILSTSDKRMYIPYLHII